MNVYTQTRSSKILAVVIIAVLTIVAIPGIKNISQAFTAPARLGSGTGTLPTRTSGPQVGNSGNVQPAQVGNSGTVQPAQVGDSGNAQPAQVGIASTNSTGHVPGWDSPANLHCLTAGVMSVDEAQNKAKVVFTNNCTFELKLSLSSYKVFNPGGANFLSTQEFFDGTGLVTLPVGSSNIFNVNIPTCYGQIDFWNGEHPRTLVDSNPYSYPNNPYVLGFAFSHTNVSCTVVSPPPAPTPPPPAGECKLEISKSVDKTTADPYNELNYTITFKNIGTANCTEVKVTDVLNDGISYLRESHPATVASASFDQNSKTVTWSVGTLNPTTSASATFVAKVNGVGSCADRSIPNNSKITSKEVTNGVISNTVTTRVKTDCPTPPPPAPKTPTLSIEKVVRNMTTNGSFTHSANAKPGETVEYRITLKNSGEGQAQSVNLTDSINTANILTSFGNFQIDRNFAGSIANGGSLTLGNLDSNGNIVASYRYVIQPSLTSNTNVCNTASAKASNTGSVSDTACVAISVVQSSNVVLNFSKKAFNDTKNQDATTINATREDFITYTLTATNTGNSEATNFVITDDLSGVLPLADMVDLGGGSLTNQTISYPAVNIAAAQSVSKTFRVRVKFSLASNISYVMTNTYGNTIKITINNPKDFVAPKTGGNTTAATAIGFGALLTAGYALNRKKNLAKLIFS